VPGGRPARARYPGEAFGLLPGEGRGVRRDPAVDVELISTLRVYSLRLRVAALALTHLALVVLEGCSQAGLVGPAGDALHALGGSVALEATSSADAVEAAADELDRQATVLLAGGPAAVSPARPSGGRQ
jgi:hypothetical protein